MKKSKENDDRVMMQFRCSEELRSYVKALSKIRKQSVDSFLAEQITRIVEPYKDALNELEKSINSHLGDPNTQETEEEQD